MSRRTQAARHVEREDFGIAELRAAILEAFNPDPIGLGLYIQVGRLR